MRNCNSSCNERGPTGRAVTHGTVVRDAEGHVLPAPLLPKGDEPGLRDLSHDGGQVLLLAAAVARRRSLGVSGICTVAAGDHRFTLKLGENGLVGSSVSADVQGDDVRCFSGLNQC